VIRAAGGVLRRDGKIAIVHRPRRDDWSLPKGKLEPGEDDAAAALREVLEETGHRAVIEHDLGTVSYAVADGTPKTVRYYVMRAEGAAAELADDVDEVAWLAPDAAGRLLTYPLDHAVLERARPHLASTDSPAAAERARQLRVSIAARRRVWATVPKPAGAERIGVPGPSLGAGVDGEVHWFTDRRFPGFLFRVRWADGGLWLERPGESGTWEQEPDLLDYFIGNEPGAVEIDLDTARALAQAKGVQVDAER
jgi:8-oxo-dGTP diphosphatase